MHSRHPIILCSILLLAGALTGFSISVPAQSLPQLKADGEIAAGRLRCGVDYYLAVEKSAPGIADMAVVFRGGDAPEGALDEGFFYRHGVTPRHPGFRSRTPGGSGYRFYGLPFYDANVLDSTLLVAFRLISSSEEKTPAALVLAGDIDTVEVRKKMDIFSMIVPGRRGRSSVSGSAGWDGTKPPVLRFSRSEDPSLSVSYSAPRVPSSLMNTAQYLVSDILAKEFVTILRHRLWTGFLNSGIPVESCEVDYIGSGQTDGDESFAVTVKAPSESLWDALGTVSRTFGALQSFGVGEQEFTDAKSFMTGYMLRWAARPFRDSQVDRCIAHFLYGATLAPTSTESTLFAGKKLSARKETALFNDFSSSLVTGVQNLSVEMAAPLDSLDTEELQFRYNLGYLMGSVIPDSTDYRWGVKDTLALVEKSSRLKVIGLEEEPVSGGELWTFSSGLRVIFKQMETTGRFSYSMVMPAFPGASAGRLPLGALGARSVEMRLEEAQSYTALSGTAPREELQLVLDALAGTVSLWGWNPDSREVFIVLCGDPGEAQEVRKVVAASMSVFEAEDTPLPRRQFRPAAEIPSTVEVLAGVPLSGVSRPASAIAFTFLRRAIASRASRYGLGIEVDAGFVVSPSEKLRLLVSAEAPGVDAQTAKRVIREGIKAAVTMPVPAEDLQALKTVAKARHESLLNSEDGIISLVTARYAYGKDFVTHFDDDLARVDEERIRSILKAVAEGEFK